MKLPDTAELLASQSLPDMSDLLAMTVPNATQLLANIPAVDYSALLASVKLPDTAELLASQSLPDMSALLASVKLPDTVELLANIPAVDYSALLASMKLPDTAELLASRSLPDMSALLASVKLPEFPDFIEELTALLAGPSSEVQPESTGLRAERSLENPLEALLALAIVGAHGAITAAILESWKMAMLFLRLAAWAQNHSPELQGALFIFGLISIVQFVRGFRRSASGNGDE